MSNDLLFGYYERELDYVRNLADEFAKRYPQRAGQLLFDRNQSDDPHVERLIQAFAFVAARIQLRLDDDYPEFADALLQQLFPHALKPLPATTIVQFDVHPQHGRIREGVKIPRHTPIKTRRTRDAEYRFRCAYPLRLWPLVLEHAEQVPLGTHEMKLAPDAKAGLLLRFRTASGEPISDYAISSLRLFLDGDSSIVHALYEAIFGRADGAILRTKPDAGLRLPQHCLREVGFAQDEALYEESGSGRLGYQLLQEYFAFQQKFLFVDIEGLDALQKTESANSFEILITLSHGHDRLENTDLKQYFKLGCTPAVNLFEMPPFAVLKDGRQIEYRIVPDHRAPLDYEIHTIRKVTSTRPGETGEREYRSFFALRYGDARDSEQSFFHERRALSTRPEDWGTDVFLTLVDESYQPIALEQGDVLHVNALCSNRDRLDSVLFGDPAGDFVAEGFPAVQRIAGLRKSTTSLRPRLRGATRWELVSHLSLNHLALVSESEEEAEDARRAFTELLHLHELSGDQANRQRIDSLKRVTGKRVTRLLAGVGAVRGIGVELTFDETKLKDSSAFLFGAVLERFLGLFASINSFTQTKIRTQQRSESIKEWPPRTGHRQLV